MTKLSQHSQPSYTHFCFLYMTLQTIVVIRLMQDKGVSYSADILYDDIQFIQRLPQEEIISKIT